MGSKNLGLAIFFGAFRGNWPSHPLGLVSGQTNQPYVPGKLREIPSVPAIPVAREASAAKVLGMHYRTQPSLSPGKLRKGRLPVRLCWPNHPCHQGSLAFLHVGFPRGAPTIPVSLGNSKRSWPKRGPMCPRGEILDTRDGRGLLRPFEGPWQGSSP